MGGQASKKSQQIQRNRPNRSQAQQNNANQNQLLDLDEANITEDNASRSAQTQIQQRQRQPQANRQPSNNDLEEQRRRQSLQVANNLRNALQRMARRHSQQGHVHAFGNEAAAQIIQQIQQQLVNPTAQSQQFQASNVVGQKDQPQIANANFSGKQTITLNNEMALRPKSIQLVCDPYNNECYRVEFTLDCFAQVEVSIMLCGWVQEDPIRKLVVNMFQQQFDAPAMEIVNIIQPGKNLTLKTVNSVNFAQLFKQQGSQKSSALVEENLEYYPLIIKLRKLQQAQSTLQPQKEQILFYLCEFEMESSEEQKQKQFQSFPYQKVKLLKTKLELDQEAFEVQEIYGIQSSTLNNQFAQLNDQEKECIVCLTDLIDTVILPCRHMCICLTCAKSLQSSKNKSSRCCPICRKEIETFLRLKRPDAPMAKNEIESQQQQQQVNHQSQSDQQQPRIKQKKPIFN